MQNYWLIILWARWGWSVAYFAINFCPDKKVVSKRLVSKNINRFIKIFLDVLHSMKY
jgi:hypothetical protein